MIVEKEKKRKNDGKERKKREDMIFANQRNVTFEKQRKKGFMQGIETRSKRERDTSVT